MTRTSLRCGLILALVVPALAGWGAVSAQIRTRPQPAIPQPQPFNPPRTQPVIPQPQPFNPPRTQPAIPQPQPFNPPRIQPAIPQPVLRTTYTCTRCGHVVTVSAGGSPPAICPGCKAHNGTNVVPVGNQGGPAGQAFPSRSSSSMDSKTLAIIIGSVVLGAFLVVGLVVVLILTLGGSKARKPRPRRRRPIPDLD